VCCLALGCSHRAADVHVAWRIDPTPPVAGTSAVVRVRLAHGDGSPVTGAQLQLEAHMSHPGMAPSTATVIESGGGAYEARVLLPMAGDWTFVVTGRLPDGSRTTSETRIAAVPAG
jgi:hypothetical protein